MMAAMNTTERQKKTRMLERSHSRVPPEIEIALLYRCGMYVYGESKATDYILAQKREWKISERDDKYWYQLGSFGMSSTFFPTSNKSYGSEVD